MCWSMEGVRPALGEREGEVAMGVMGVMALSLRYCRWVIGVICQPEDQERWLLVTSGDLFMWQIVLVKS